MSIEHTYLSRLAEFGLRWHGVDLQMRRHGTGWPELWRARIVATKNEREDFRLTVYAVTPEAAIDALAKAVAEQGG